MIYTVTLNPALDYVIQLENFTADGINRVRTEHVYPGGKGINVAVIASNLGMNSKALGFKAGNMGNALEQMLQSYGCSTHFVSLPEGETRINVKVKAETEFEINGQGPEVSAENLEKFLEQLKQLRTGDVLVLSGSIPKSMPENIYELIMERLKEKDICIIVDAEGRLLQNALKYRPFLIKPNNHELEAFFGSSMENGEQIVEAAKKLQTMGARNVLVSMAEKGAFLITEEGAVYQALPPSGIVVNSVGAGDSMVAGFLVGYLQDGNYEAALRLGTAAGSATAFTSWLAKKEEILKLLPLVELRKF